MSLLHTLFRRSHFIVIASILVALVHSAFAIDIGPVFSDVPSTAWFYADVNSAQTAGIVSGYKDAYGRLTGKFGPENPVTVAEALKMALESAGYDISRGQGYGHWAAGYLSIAISNHFFFTQNGYINLDRPALRSEVASILADAFRVSPSSISSALTDIARDPYAEQISALARDNIITGDTDANGRATGTFRPSERINRAEAVRMTMRSRAKYPGVGNGYSSSYSWSSWSSRSSSSLASGPCSVVDCGPAPMTPNWQCPDGSIAGPACERLPDLRCGWLIKQCGVSSSASRSSSRSSSSSVCRQTDCGAMPAIAYQCPDGRYVGPTCGKLPDGRCGWLMAQCLMSSSSSSSSIARATHTVRYTLTGFQPSLITIRKGDTIDFRNDTDFSMWVASNPHPSHSDYPSLDSKVSKAKNGIYTFTFTTVGVFGYHNHQKPEHLGVVVVAE